MLLPVGHEETTVRRVPWVTFSIIGLCVVVYILTAGAPSNVESIEAAERRAVEYFLDHPYLELDPELKGYLYYSLRQRGGPEIVSPEDPGEQLGEQRELDVLVAAFYDARNSIPYYRWGLVPTQQRPTAWLTHMLMHAGFLHLFGNLFLLYLVGPAMEDAWGHVLFALFYVASGMVAAFFFIAGFPDLNQPLVGASGAIAGVMGAFAVRYWNTRITFFYWLFFLKIYTGTFAAPAWLMLGLWVLAQIAFASGWWAFTTTADMGNVAFEAHIAGFAFGAAIAFLIKKLEIEEVLIKPRIESAWTVYEAPSIAAALDLAHQGRVEEALERLENDLERDPRNLETASALWNIASGAGRESDVAPRMIAPLEVAARIGDDALPLMCWANVLRAFPEAPISGATATRLGEIVLEAGQTEAAAETLRWLEGRVDASTPVGQLTRLARVADRLRVRGPFAELALKRSGLPPEIEEELQELVSR